MQSKNHNAESGIRGVHRVSSPSPSIPGMVKVNHAAPPRGGTGAPSLGVHGFVGKKTEDPNALKLLIAASEYAAAAASRLAQDASGAASVLPQLIDDYVDIVFGLEVHFVFPNLSAEKRDLLVAIMKVRNSISAVLNEALRGGSARDKAALQKLTADLEKKFLEFRSQIVESGIEKELDPIQKKIFQDEFFSITLDKKCSTTLFFRTDAAPRPTSGAGRIRVPEAAGKSELSSRPRRDAIPPFEPSVHGLAPHILRQDQSPKPVINRDVAVQQPVRVLNQPDPVPQLPDVTPDLPAVAPHLSGLTPHLTDATLHRPDQRVQGRKTVLLISADSGAQDLVGNALRQAGYNLLLANAGFSGYATAMRERPDLVLVDLSLSLEVSGPDAYLDGRGVLKMLSKLPSGRALPFLGLVSSGGSETQTQVLALGARACLLKPLDPRLVLDAVENAWADPRSETDEASRSRWTVSASV